MIRKLSLFAPILLAACTGGYVNDAATGTALPGTLVTAGATCVGNGCQSANGPSTTSQSGGLWAFDAYGNVNGTGDIQRIQPLPGHDTENIVFLKSGYLPLVVYHRPVLATYAWQGKNYEADQVPTVFLCDNNQADSDGDGICDLAESHYGTNPLSKDTDGDAIDDKSELFGGSLNAGDGADLRYFGASPTHKDVFVYYNYYAEPIDPAMSYVVQAFANSPATNPDGKTGIALHILSGGPIAAADQVANIVGMDSGDYSTLTRIKNKYMPARYVPFMHYGLFADQILSDNFSGISPGAPAHDFIVSLGAWLPKYGTQLEQESTFMHELGHNLGLLHGGDEDNNCKPNYVSVMNYMYQTNAMFSDATIFDYSIIKADQLAENKLYEANGITYSSLAGHETKADFTIIRAGDTNCQKTGNSHVVQGSLGQWIDWNNNKTEDTAAEMVDLDGDGFTISTFKATQNDWWSLRFGGSSAGGGKIYGPADVATLNGTAGVEAPQLRSPTQLTHELKR